MRNILLCCGTIVLLNVQSSFTGDVHEKELQLKDVGVLILSQNNSYHSGRAERLYRDIKIQLTHLNKDQWPEVVIAHEKWDSIGYWTLFPILKQLAWTYSKHAWLFICEEETKVNLNGLLKVLKKYDYTQHYFLGKPLYDDYPVIQHHFESDKKFAYPDFSAGFLISIPLLKELASNWPLPKFKADFTIDPKHEVAMYLKMIGVMLTPVPELCTEKKNSQCVTTNSVPFPVCGPMIPDEDLYVAVKTCEKYHSTRLNVVIDTWARESRNIEFISETEDKSIPTISLGVPNTERGHCGKTFAILKRFHNSRLKTPWLLIADDDTIINLKLLRKLLSCYDPTEPVSLGERYGYSVAMGNGYNYITGGGGMVFSRETVDRLMTSGICSCPKNDSPDDMILGMCLKRLSLPITHSLFFHQARLKDYPEDFLNPKLHISFHKHWDSDPYDVYRAITDIEDKIDLVKTQKRPIRRDEL
ncbi:hypothetical protein ScPMuIL_006480 [Solemya velum]